MLNTATERKQKAENQLKELLGANEVGIRGNRIITWKTTIQERLDSKLLKAEQPELFKQYLNQISFRKFMEERIIDINHQLQRTSDTSYLIESTKTNAGTRRLPMTEDVYTMFKTILENRPTNLPEIMIDGYCGFLFRDKNGMPEVAMHWEHRFKNAVQRYNDIFKLQMPSITPHVCRHTYCSNQAKSGMNPKTLQYLMGHSDISVTMNTYTHLGMDYARDEMIRLEELEQARKEIEKTKETALMQQDMFKAI